MKFILGTKQHMLTVFTEDGRAHAATLVAVEPAVVAQVKTAEKDGYGAVQIGSGETKESRVNKAQLGHAGKPLKFFREYRLGSDEKIDLEKGASIEAAVFAEGDHVQVSAISKGKGFQGV